MEWIRTVARSMAASTAAAGSSPSQGSGAACQRDRCTTACRGWSGARGSSRSCIADCQGRRADSERGANARNIDALIAAPAGRAAGVTYQELLDLTRREAADRYLRVATLSVGEVAYLLGYSEAAAFHRAFKRWNGIGPQEFRDRQREDQRSAQVP